MTDDRKDQDSHCKHPVHAAVNKQILFMVYKALLLLVAVLVVVDAAINPKWRQVPPIMVGLVIFMANLQF